MKISRKIVASILPKKLQKAVVGCSTKPEIFPAKTPQPKASTKSSKFMRRIKPFLCGLDKSTIKELEACEVNEFLDKARQIINKQHKIPKELASDVIVTELPFNAGACYVSAYNTILVPPKTLKKSRLAMFSYMKHEIQHQVQNFTILRTEGLSKKYCEVLARDRAITECKIFAENYRNLPLEDIDKLQIDENAKNVVRAYKKAIADGKEKEFLEEMVANDSKNFIPMYEEFRQDILKYFPPIKQGSEEEKLAQKYYEGFINGKIGSVKTQYFAFHEVEALTHQGISMYEYLFAKFLG